MEYFPVIFPLDHVLGRKDVITIHILVRPGITVTVVAVVAQIGVLRRVYPHDIIPHVRVGVGRRNVGHQWVATVSEFQGNTVAAACQDHDAHQQY